MRTRSPQRCLQPVTAPPSWIAPQLARLVDQPPDGDDWLHEIKLDGYRLHARLDRGQVRLLTRTGLDWSAKYPYVARAITALPVEAAYLDGEICALRADGTTSFSELQAARDDDRLIFFAFDLLHLGDDALAAKPLRYRKARLAALLAGADDRVRYLDHHDGDGPAFYEAVCILGLEGIVSKRARGAYLSGDRHGWRKVKCENREEFIVVGWSDPEGSRHRLGSLLLGYRTPAGKLLYAGRAGTGKSDAELERLWRRLQPLAVDRMPMGAPPPRNTRFGRPLALERVHWTRPEMVVEVRYQSWTADGLLRHVTYLGEREDKPPGSVVREPPPVQSVK